MGPQGQEDRNMEKNLLVLLFIITVTQFGVWGYQSVHYILSSMFNVETSATPLDVVVGFIAMVSSALIFTGAALWWKAKVSAFAFITNGSLIFMIKNVLDLMNEVWRFSLQHTTVNAAMISELAQQLAEQFFQLAFWVFIYFYFRSKIQARMNGISPLPQA